MDNNERITPDNATPAAPVQPAAQQSPFGQEVPSAPVNAAPSEALPEPGTPPAPTGPVEPAAPAEPVAPVSPAAPAQPAAPAAAVPPTPPANPAFNGVNTTQTLQQPQAPQIPTAGAFIPKAMNPANLQGGNQAVTEDMENKAHYMRDILHKQPKVAIMIPLAFGEKPGSMHPFGVNGYFYYVQKGVMVKVPEQIAEMATESFNLDYANGAEIDLSRNEDKQRALSR